MARIPVGIRHAVTLLSRWFHHGDIEVLLHLQRGINDLAFVLPPLGKKSRPLSPFQTDCTKHCA
eukprot:9331750-Alexandrium_andersonii.AAC.1